MRRLFVLISAVFGATFLVSIAAISAQAVPADRQYEPSDGSEASANTRESSGNQDFVSQGSTAGDTPEALAARRDLAVEERLPDYSQVVDNSSKSRFVAPGWTRDSGEGSHGEDHALARAGSNAKKATFRVKIPSSNDYAIYAWWTASKDNASAARFEISTASGRHTEKINQTKDGGMWIKLGAFAMKKGERTVRVSPSGNADVVADAVTVIRGEQGFPVEKSEPLVESGDALRSAARAGSRANGRDIVRVARRYKSRPYRYSTCTRFRMSCTCETKKALAPFRHKLRMSEGSQWRYEPSWRVHHKYNLHRGDIVFFKEGGKRGRITHVGVYSGRGNLVHASSYFGKVVESKMKYIRGYFGAIRVHPR